MLRHLSTLALGAAVLAAPMLAPHTVRAPWDQGDCQAAWCGKASAMPARDPLVTVLADRAADAQARARYGCVTPYAWSLTHDGPPVRMVVRDAGGVRVTPWTYPAPAGAWVLGFCD